MSCENNELARRGPFQIHRCSECDGFSLHLGAITLRLDEQAIRNLEQMLQEGMIKLDQLRQEKAKTTPNTTLLFPPRVGNEPSN